MTGTGETGISPSASIFDRTTVKHLERIAPDRAAAIRWKAQARSIDALPRRIPLIATVIADIRVGRVMRKVDGWQTLATKTIDPPIDLAA